jgi:protein tyrosine/serine phosphatase
MKRVLAVFPSLLAAILFFRAAALTQTSPPAAPPPHYSFGEILRIPGIPNSAKVTEHLYRGAQPRQPGLAQLQKMGIATIVDLRNEEKNRIAWEQKTAQSLGIQFVNIPVNQWAAPSNDQVAQFLSVFRDHPEQKVFVHCTFGDDRTGVFVAAYRMAFDKFPPAEALKEMDHFGFNSHWHKAMIAYVRSFPKQLQTAPELAAFR